ncbi:triosephosphate isomerase [Vairimorpha necatrix]|uniref:Triosephosphate isomerase n=1 Tax=Vairimorpha necatrix TaxID=6039 RepID=A0AAX4J8U5_9MICR
MKPIIIGNWKANKNFTLFNKIPSTFDNIEISIALPYVFIPQTINYNKSHISIAAQDCSKFDKGAYTGEIPAIFLKENHVKYVIIGHSERRIYLKEDSNQLTAKIKNALNAGLRVIYCIGETSTERNTGDYLKVLYNQFFSVIGKDIEIDIAYEPVWSIGTGIFPKIEEIKEVVEQIKKWSNGINVKGRIIFGGSVSYEYIDSINDIKEIDGLLIGGMSLKDEFIDICEKFNNLKANK